MGREETAFAGGKIRDFLAGDDTALPFVYGCFAGEDPDLIWDAARALWLRMRSLAPEELVRFLERMSEYTSLEWTADWRALRPARLRGALDGDGYFAMLAAGSFHPNGYYRENCLRELCGFGGRALPFLLLRANDWVLPVRELALEEAGGILEGCPPKQALDALPYLYRLGRGRRRDEKSYARLLAAAERRLAASPELLTPERLRRVGREGRRLCCGIVLREGLYSPDDWARVLRREPDPVTRGIAARAMLMDPQREKLLPVLLKSPDGRLRLLALQDVFDREGAAWGGFESFLCDQRQGVRELAQFALRRQDPARNLAAWYRERLWDGPGALLGLSETGGPADAGLVRPCLASDSPGVRKAALTALGRLCGDAELETYYAALLEGGGLSKIAFRIFQSRKLRVPCARLYGDLLRARDPAVARRLCTLIGQNNPWDSLPWLLRLWSHPDPELRERARFFLSRWGCGYLRPLPGQAEEIRRAYAGSRGELPERLARRLEFELAHGGISLRGEAAEMVDVNKPVTNPELTRAIAKMREENTVQAQNRMIDEMMRAHFLIPAQISPVPQTPDAEGKTVLKEHTTIGFSMIEDGEGRQFFLAFTDWEELRRWKAQENQQTVILTFDDYAAMLAEERSTAAGFVINPFGGNVTMTREMVRALKEEKDRRAAGGAVEQVVKKDTAVQLGEPRVYPQAMVGAVKERLKFIRQVKAAWLRLMVREGEQSWLLVLEFAGDRRGVFDETARAARPYLDGMYLDMVPLDSDFGRQAVRNVEPFYRRRRFGLF